ncbi:MAG: hypothetical protein GWO20_11885 [Candidatus Korarchaeota archaeon]|nr:hypothetical protein [Candidatus Korarchaeota archaeon]NIW14277.1 hypothetical protein [Candidatus Thorarchaeota archaeon]
MIDVVEESFPAEIIDGVVQTKNDTTQLTECIKATYKTYLVPKDSWECGSPNGGDPSLLEFYQRVEPEKIVKMFRALLADKNIVLVDYDEMLASKLVSNIDEIWPERVELAPGSEIDSSIHTEQKTIFTAGKGMEPCLEEKADNVMFVYSDRSMKGSLKGDRLLETMNEHFENGSKESINTILEDEIFSLNAIRNDIEKLISNADGDVSLKYLKKQLSKTYSPDTVTYELEVLAAENSPLLTNVKSSENPLEDLFLPRS